METKKRTDAHFRSQDRPGFCIRFENGWTISVQWHNGAYCERKSLSLDSFTDSNPADSATAEIAIWNEEGDWYDFGSDQVLGYCTPDEVADWITKTKSFAK